MGRKTPDKKSRMLLILGFLDIAMAVIFYAVFSRIRPEMRLVIPGVFIAIALMNFTLSYAFKKKAERLSTLQSDFSEPTR